MYRRTVPGGLSALFVLLCTTAAPALAPRLMPESIATASGTTEAFSLSQSAEQADAFSRIGAGIILSANVSKVLRRLDLERGLIERDGDFFGVGNGLDKDVQMGPSVSAGQLKTVESYVKIGVDEGATIVADLTSETTEQVRPRSRVSRSACLRTQNAMRSRSRPRRASRTIPWVTGRSSPSSGTWWSSRRRTTTSAPRSTSVTCVTS